MAPSTSSVVLTLLPILFLLSGASAHEHHGEAVPEGEVTTKDPIVHIPSRHASLY